MIDRGCGAPGRESSLQQGPATTAHFKEHILLPEGQCFEDGVEAR
jgi:hypothetical protein